MKAFITKAKDQVLPPPAPLGNTYFGSNVINTQDQTSRNELSDSSSIVLYLLYLVLFCVSLTILSGCSEAKTDADYLESAKSHLDKKDFSAADIELKNALIQNSENPEAHLLLGTTALKLANGELAEKELRRAHELGVSRDGVLLPLAESLLLQGKYDQVTEFHPGNSLSNTDTAELHVMRGKAFLGDNKPEEAAGEFRRASELEPELASAMAGEARLAAYNGNLEEARTWVREALAVDAEYAEAWSLLGYIELKSRNPADAETAFTRSIELRDYLGSSNIDIASRAKARIYLDKYREAEEDIRTLKRGGVAGHPTVQYIAGLLYFKQGKYTEAVAAFEDSHNKNPYYTPAEYLLAASQFMLGNTEQALATAQRIQNKLPESVSSPLKGAIYIEQSDYDEATNVLSASLDRSPDNEVILTMLANASLLKGDTAQSVKYYEQLASLNPDSSAAKTRLMMARLMDNQPLGINGTEGTLELPQTGGDEYSRDLLGALEAFRDGKLVLAMERARQLRDKYPDKTDPLKITSSVYLASGMWGDARTELEKLLTLAPGDRHAMVNLAKLEIEAGNLERARNLLREVTESNPQDEQAVLLLVDVERRLGDQQAATQVLEQAVTRAPGAVSLRMALAEQYYRTGELTRVLEITNDLTSEQLQNHPAILELRGKAQERLGDPVAARSTFQRWTQLAPESAPAHYQYANSLAKTGERERAMTMLEQAVQLDPGYLPARIGEIKMQVHSGEVEVAKKTLAKLKTDFGDHPEVLGIEGWFALGTGDFTTAERAFSTALKTRPSSQTTILLSRALLGQQKKDEAVTVLQDWLNTNPRDLAVQLELADNYLTHDNHKAAIASYERVLELSPNNTKALNNLAWLSQDRDLEKSIEYAEKAQELQPNDPLVLDTYGMLLLKQGDIMKAGKMLQRAADRAPDDLTIQLHLAQVLIRQQEYASAITALKKVLEKAPETGEAKEARILLESIPGQ